jgi:hypothetical protein
MRHKEEQDKLINLLHHFASQGLSWSVDYDATISPLTASTAELFLRGVPARKVLPKISPDGDGGLMMAWEGIGDPLIVTIDDLRISAVVAAATPRAEYLDRIPYVDGATLPAEILKEIPNR